MQKVIVAIIVVLAGFFILRRFRAFIASARGKGAGCGHCGCSDKKPRVD